MAAKIVELTSSEGFDSLLALSFDRPVALLKHSETCGISADIYYQLESVVDEINVVIVQRNREVSNLIAEKMQHRHQSPQAFVIKNGRSIYHATHYGVDPAAMRKLLQADIPE